MSTGVIFPTSPSGREFFGTGTVVPFHDVTQTGWSLVSSGVRDNAYAFAISGSNSVSDYVYAVSSGGYIITSAIINPAIPAAPTQSYQMFAKARTTVDGYTGLLTVGVHKTSDPSIYRDLATFTVSYAAFASTPTYWVLIEGNPFGGNMPYAASSYLNDNDGNAWNFYLRSDGAVSSGRMELYNVYAYTVTPGHGMPLGGGKNDYGHGTESVAIAIAIAPPTDVGVGTDTPQALVLAQPTDTFYWDDEDGASKHITRRNAIWVGGTRPNRWTRGDRPRQ